MRGNGKEDIIDEFWDGILELYTSYKIALMGLLQVNESYANALKINPDLKNFIIRDENHKYEIKLDAIDFVKKNSRNGYFKQTLAGVYLSSIYQLWEDKYREELAILNNKPKSQIKSELIGEIRILRQAIIHNNFKPITDLKKMKILDFIKIDDFINLSFDEMSKIILLLDKEMDLLRKEYCA